MNLSFLQRLTTFIQFYCGPPVVSADGAGGEDEGSSAMVGTTALGSTAVGTTFSSVVGGTTLTSDLVSCPTTGWTTLPGTRLQPWTNGEPPSPTTW